MRLRDLDAEFIQHIAPNPDMPHGGYRRVGTLEDAQGIVFQCPKCAIGCDPGEEDGRRFVRGAHYVLCWFRNPRTLPPVADDVDPKPGRWWAVGTGIDDLTFDFGTPPIAKSVLLLAGCGWHGFVTNGDAS